MIRASSPARARGSGLISCSQMTIVSMPRSSSNPLVRESRSRFIVNFLAQNSPFALGSGRAHEGHRCQKQPLIEIASAKRGNRMSGLPGRRGCTRYPLAPAAHNAFRNATSRFETARFARIVLAAFVELAAGVFMLRDGLGMPSRQLFPYWQPRKRPSRPIRIEAPRQRCRIVGMPGHRRDRSELRNRDPNDGP